MLLLHCCVEMLTGRKDSPEEMGIVITDLWEHSSEVLLAEASSELKGRGRSRTVISHILASGQ